MGYSQTTDTLENSEFPLPPLKPGVLTPIDATRRISNDANTVSRLDLLYAKDYSVWQDFDIVLRNIKLLGR